MRTFSTAYLGGPTPSINNYVYLISDLAFNANGELLAGVRVSCKSSFFSSYNHFSETNLITKNTGTGKFDNTITELDISATGSYANEDTYGGVATYTNDSGNDIFAVSSSDILNESGPHGIAIFNDPPNAGEITPLAAVSYGVVGNDPKGVGGDVELWTSCLEIDFGDLPDLADGTTGVNDYETYAANGGPSHIIIPNLFLGDTIDADADGFPNAQALGDDQDNVDDEDGIILLPSLDISPGGILRLPFSVTNTTGDTAYVEAWIDWNGDGDFDLVSEIVADYKDNEDGVFPNFMTITVPNTVLKDNSLGFRVRLSNSNNMTPYGRVNSGEIEDYLLTIDCSKMVCLPITAEKKE